MNRTSRWVVVSDPLWTALETMSREMGVDRDVLLNQAIFSLARQFGFITPTQVSLMDAPAEVPAAAVDAAPPPQVPASEALPESMAPGWQAPAALPESAPPVSEAPAPLVEDARPVEQAPFDEAEARLLEAERIRDILQDVERLVEPVDERLGEEDASEESSATAEESVEEESESSDVEEDSEAGDDEAPDSQEPLAAREDAPLPRPATRAENTVIVQTLSGLPLYIQLDKGEPVLISRERFIIGRGAHCDLMVKSGRVSREHAAVVREGAEFFIEDLESSNGTWFDHTRITRRLISDGEEYLLGGIRVTFTQR